MRFIAFALLAVAAMSAEGGKKICEPGSYKKVDCNDCVCSKDGTAYGCTLMLCPEDSPFEVRTRRQAIDTVCEPGEVMHDGCNTCFCLGDGSGYVCTMKACYEHNSLLRSAAEEPKQGCNPGERKKMQCNDCFCTANGFDWACTAMACPEYFNQDGSLKLPNEIANNPLLRETREIEDNNEKECVPGKSFKLYCNNCICGRDGKIAGCTRMACPPEVYNEDGSRKAPALRSNNNEDVSEERICEPGKSFKDECNTCVCNKDGKSAICTLMFCIPNALRAEGSDLALKLPKVCEPGKSFLRDCNRCFCSRDGTSAVCTLMNCPPQTEDKQKRSVDIAEPSNQFCSPGETFKIECNSCVCGVDGTTALCDFKFCGSRHAKTERSTSQFCEPGKSYKQGCNSCICNKDGTGAACTLKLCLPAFLKLERSLPKVCQPGKSFKDDCNDCICNKYGTGAVCTLQLCPPELERTERSVAQICEPGTSFKSDCNICTCNEYGTNAACTLQYCGRRSATVTRSVARVCEPGKFFKESCNNCICNKYGTNAACTLMLCPEDEGFESA